MAPSSGTRISSAQVTYGVSQAKTQTIEQMTRASKVKAIRPRRQWSWLVVRRAEVPQMVMLPRAKKTTVIQASRSVTGLGQSVVVTIAATERQRRKDGQKSA